MITKIHFKNYRSLGDVTLEMGGLNVNSLTKVQVGAKVRICCCSTD